MKKRWYMVTKPLHGGWRFLMINRKKILIADCDALNLDFFDIMLSKLGFVVEKAQDGQTVLDKIAGSGGSLAPDILILNTVLPKVSGWEILKAIKADPKTMLTPVLLLSEIDDVNEIVEAFEIGADDYIIKPFNFSVVLARIRAALRNNVLFSQLRTREKRLALAEQLNTSLKHGIINIQDSIEDLIIEIMSAPKNIADTNDALALTERLKNKALLLQNVFSKIEGSIDQIESEWENLKEQEIGLPILEKPIRSTVEL
jgi:DNA-binding response OmpR family regulator